MIFLIVLTIFLGVYLYTKWKFTYWKKRGLPYQEPSFPFGSYGLPTRSFMHPSIIIKNYYDHFKSLGHKHFGVFLSIKPVYIAIHPEIVKKIMVQDFHHFHSRGFYYNSKDDPMSASFTFLEGQEWKNRRQKLIPAFTSAKIKMMFHILQQCTDQFIIALAKISASQDAIDIRKTIDCLTTNIMAASAFGFECKNYEDQNNDLQKYGKKYFMSLSPIHILKWLIAYSNKTLARFLKITLLPKDATDYFFNVFHDTVEFRERTKFYRPDLMQLLISIKNEGLSQPNKNTQVTLTPHQTMAADAFLLNLTGLEASSSAINFCLFELAAHPDIQEKVRDEVTRVVEQDNGKITYDNLTAMKYLNQVLDESLRKYPPAPILSRICNEDYKVPNTNVTIEKGTFAIIPILALHYDAEYFPDPEKFDPERFNELNKSTLLPFTYLPYGEGPRTCIASRFGYIINKLVVATMVKKFSFTLNEKTSPFQKFDPLNHSFSFQNSILMDIKKL